MKRKSILKKQRQLKRKNTEYYKKALLRSVSEIGVKQGDAELLDLIYAMPRFKETKETIIKACGEDGFQEILDYIRKHEK